MNSENNSTILLVEDEALIALDEAEEIRELGYEVKTADCGEEAVRLATSDPSIDLVLMDIDLGDGMDGTEAATRILQSRDLPVIFLSSHTEKDIVDKTSLITNYGYVTKDAGVTVLYASIRLATRLFAATRQVREELEQRKRYEHALKEATSLNQHIINNLNEGLVVYNTGLHYVVWNPFMERLTGVKATDILGRYPLEVFPELTETGVVENLEMAIQGETPEKIEFTIEFQGRPIRVVFSPVPLRDENDQVIGVVATVQDVTEAREDQQRLQKSEAKYRELFENAPIGIFRTDSAGRLLEANTMSARITGFASGEEAVRHYTDIGTEIWTDSEQRKDYLRKLEEDGHMENVEVCSKRVDGQRFWVSLNARVSERMDSGTFTIEGFTIDITRIREAERRLEETNARLNAMLWAIPDSVFRFDKGGVFMDYRARSEDLYVAPEVEIVGKNHRDFLPPDISELYEQKIRETREHQTLTTFTYNLEMRERGVRLREARMVPSGEDDVMVVIRDITEEAEKEARLIESESLFRAAFDNAPIGIVFSNFHNEFIRVNQAYCDMIGYSADELIGRSITEFSLPDDVDATLEAFTRYEKGESGPIHFSKRYIHRNGSIVWAEVNAAVIKDSSGKTKNLFAQIRDITKQKRSEENIRALVKEKEVLLSEVHHRIKNSLQTMASILSLQARAMDNPSAVAALEDARSRLRTMSVLYDRLHKASNFNELSVADFLSSLTDDIVASNPSTARVRINKSFEDYTVPARKLSSVGIVVNELICNAMKHAYSGRDSGNLWVEVRKKDEKAVIAVVDDGVGLPDDIGIGTSKGFGMNVVWALANQLRGEVKIERNKGTRFEIEFPI